MNTLTSVKVFVAETWAAAEETVARLRQAGLHPLDLSVSTPLSTPGKNSEFPVEVPSEERELARALVESPAGV